MELPEAVIHHILSFLPAGSGGTKEVTRVSLISKLWQHACSSYHHHVVDFCETCSYDRRHDIEKSERFLGFVDKTMTSLLLFHPAHQEQEMILSKFRLHIDFEIFSQEGKSYTATTRLAPLLDKWINIALDKKVQHLDLRIRVRWIDRHLEQDFGHDSDVCFNSSLNYVWRYHIPTRVLSSDFVKSLSLGWQVCALPPNHHDHDIILRTNNSVLRSLELVGVRDIVDNESFQRLIGACPAIENLIFDTDQKNMDEIHVFGLHHLKMLSIRISYFVDDGVDQAAGNNIIFNKLKIKIEAPSLETLCLIDIGRGNCGRKTKKIRRSYTASLDINDAAYCSRNNNVKCLILTRDFNMDNDQLHEFLSKFPKLESLQLEDCGLITHLNIQNPLLNKIELKCSHLWTNFETLQISSPNVTHFRCESTSHKRFPSICPPDAVINYPRFDHLVFRDDTQPVCLYPYWFRKLRDSMLVLNSTNNYTSLSFNYTWEKELHERKVLVPTSLPACKIDNLNLSVRAHYSSYPVIFNRILSTFHPTTLRVSLGGGIDNTLDILQFLSENLVNIRDEDECYYCRRSSSSIQSNKCWKHQLQQVKFEGVNGFVYDWGSIFKLQLSTLTCHHWICFSLQWATS